MIDSPAYVQASALICGVLGLSFGWMHLRHHDPGARWFAAGFLVIAAIFVLGLRDGPGLHTANRGAAALGAIGVIGLGFGLVEYIGPNLPHPNRWRWAIVLPVIAVAAWLPFGPLPRIVAHGLVAVALATMAAMAFQASRREPGAGLRLIAGAMLLHPLLYLGMVAAGVDVYQLRNIVLVPIAVFGMTLFTVSLTRSREALVQLNQTLEQRITQRTAELHDMVAGLESFNRSVSHDLRGPLGGVATLTRLAIDRVRAGEAEEAVRMLGIVADQADSLGRVVTDLLTLARVGDTPLARRQVDLDECVRDAIEQLRLAGQPTERIRVASPLGTVEADGGLLRQAFVNLLGNGLKFSARAAAPEVEVSGQRQGDWATIAVRDNGVGFPPERAEDLFVPFRRLHGAGYDGTGLGLTIVRRIVDRHGGSVRAEAGAGGGARFEFRLPT